MKSKPRSTFDKSEFQSQNGTLAIPLPKPLKISFLRLTDPKQRADYEIFGETHSSIISMVVLYVIYNLTGSHAFIPGVRSQNNSIEAYLVAILSGLWFILFPRLLYIKYRQNVGFSDERIRTKFRFSMIAFQNALIVIGTTCMGLTLYLRAQTGPCEDESFYTVWSCNPVAGAHGLPGDTLLKMFLFPIVFPIVFRTVKFEVVVLTWLTMLGFIAYCIVRFESYFAFYLVVTYIPLSLVIICDTQRQHLSAYFDHLKSLHLNRENQRLTEITHATEMRHMIANVTHDLKTPLSAFISGMEVISSAISELSTEVVAQCATPAEGKAKIQRVLTKVATIEESINDMQNINSFMLMTINRCIDYTKASQGVTLTPKQETLNLQEVLMLPVKVIREMQNKVQVVFDPSLGTHRSEICGHVITDRQWLVENILCLLSNAVKYSTGGSVSMKLTLVNTTDKIDRISDARLHFIVRTQNKRKKALQAKQLKDVYDIKKAAPTVRRSSTGITFSIRSGCGSCADRDVEPDDIEANNKEEDYDPYAPYDPAEENKIPEVDEDKFSTTSSIIRLKPVANAGKYARHRVAVVDTSSRQSDVIALNPSVVTAPPSTDMLMFEVQDSGIGLTDETMSGLFLPFKQTQRHSGGAGLGLYSLAKRVEALGGYYGVERNKNVNGCVFWFTVPYRPDFATELLVNTQAAETRATASAATNASAETFALQDNSSKTLAVNGRNSPTPPDIHVKTSPNSHTMENTAITTPLGSGKHDTSALNTALSAATTASAELAEVLRPLSILVVDDAVSILKMASMLLSKHGHRTDQARDGAEALKLIHDKRNREGRSYDVVLMDLQMPVMDGFEAVKRLRAFELQQENAEYVRTGERRNDDPYAHQFMISFSANSDAASMERAMAEGFDAFISKPFSLQTFVTTCQTYFADKNIPT